MSLKPVHTLTLSASMQNLDVFKDEEEITFKDKIKRTFSSIKRRRKKQQAAQIENTAFFHTTLRAVKSNPVPSLSPRERYVLYFLVQILCDAFLIHLF